MSRDAQLRFAVGDTIADRYVVFSVLGDGPTGVAYEGRDLTTQKWVVIRVVPPLVSPIDFQTDFAGVAGLASRYIVPVVAHGILEGRHGYIVSERPEGEALAAVLERGPLPAPEAMRLLAHLAQALQTAHGEKLTHGAPHPHNIYLVAQGTERQVQIADFGLAAYSGALQTTAGPAHADYAADPNRPFTAFLAPELLAGGNPSPASDVYAWGLVALSLLTGSTIIRGKTIDECRRSHATLSPQLLTSSLEPDYAQAIICALAGDPGDRFADGQGLIAALGLPDAAEPPGPITEVSFGRSPTKKASALPFISSIKTQLEAKGRMDAPVASGAKTLSGFGKLKPVVKDLPDVGADTMALAPIASPNVYTEDDVMDFFDDDAIVEEPAVARPATPPPLGRTGRPTPPPAPGVKRPPSKPVTAVAPAQLPPPPSVPPPPLAPISGVAETMAMPLLDMAGGDDDAPTQINEAIDFFDVEPVKEPVAAAPSPGPAPLAPPAHAPPSARPLSDEVPKIDLSTLPASGPIGASGARTATSGPAQAYAGVGGAELKSGGGALKVAIVALVLVLILGGGTVAYLLATRDDEPGSDKADAAQDDTDKPEDDDPTGDSDPAGDGDPTGDGDLTGHGDLKAAAATDEADASSPEQEDAPAADIAEQQDGALAAADEDTAEATADVAEQDAVAVAEADTGEPDVSEPPVDEPPVDEPPVDEPPVMAVGGLPAACGGDAEGCVKAAKRMAPSDGEGAVEMLRQACDAGAPPACVELARMLFEGDNIKRDRSGAYAVHEQACAKGSKLGCVEKARMLERGHGVESDSKEAAGILEPLCDGGLEQACLLLGTFAERGRGMKRNYELAAQLHEKACDSGSGEACFRLSDLYRAGKGVGSNAGKQVELLGKACDLRFGEACQTLADAYRKGKGVDKDPSQMVHFYDKACSAGLGEACSRVCYMYQNGQDVEKDLEKALNFCAMGCRGGHEKSCYRGALLATEIGTAASAATEKELLELGCEMGYKKACKRLKQ